MGRYWKKLLATAIIMLSAALYSTVMILGLYCSLTVDTEESTGAIALKGLLIFLAVISIIIRRSRRYIQLPESLRVKRTKAKKKRVWPWVRYRRQRANKRKYEAYKALKKLRPTEKASSFDIALN